MTVGIPQTGLFVRPGAARMVIGKVVSKAAFLFIDAPIADQFQHITWSGQIISRRNMVQTGRNLNNAAALIIRIPAQITDNLTIITDSNTLEE